MWSGVKESTNLKLLKFLKCFDAIFHELENSNFFSYELLVSQVIY